MLRELLQRMPTALERLCADMQTTLDALDGKARNGVAVQARLLRVVRLMVVREMLTRAA